MLFFLEATKKCWNPKRKEPSPRVDPEEPGILQTGIGEENITRFAVHLDEKTPHIHCVFVPITEDGRLSAGDWVGNR